MNDFEVFFKESIQSFIDNGLVDKKLQITKLGEEIIKCDEKILKEITQNRKN